MKTLECSSKGDNRFSAFYACIKVFGYDDSIENHYQLSKRFGNVKPKTWRDAKGRKVTHFEVNGFTYDVKYLTQWYKLLWLRYLNNNPLLVEYARTFDEFSDMFKGKSVNCQADVIRQYVKEGVESITLECQPLLKEMKKNRGA